MDLVALPDLSVFQFISEGVQGRITKQIHFIQVYRPGIYILQLGDIDENGGFDRSLVSNNGDRNRVLATVILAIEVYTERYPDRSIRIWSYFAERSRLFRIAIGNNLQQLSASFTIQEIGEDGFLFFKKDINSADFELRRKKIANSEIRTTLKIQSRLFKKAISVQLSKELEKGFNILGGKKAFAHGIEGRERRRIKKPAFAGRVGDSEIR